MNENGFKEHKLFILSKLEDQTLDLHENKTVQYLAHVDAGKPKFIKIRGEL